MMKIFTLKLFATMLFLLGISSQLVAQISSYSVTTPLDKCQPATSAQLSIGATTATNLFITMPVGIIYTAGSATCSGNPVAAPVEVVNGNGTITYDFTISNCVGTFIYQHSANCGVDETATLFDIAQLKNGTTLVGGPFQSLSYNVGEATPQVSSSSNLPASINVLASSTRTVNITNGGLGVTNDFYFEDIVPHNSLTFDLASVKLNGNTIPSGNITFNAGATEDTLRVHFTSVQFATFGNNDNSFDGVRSPGPGQESFVLTYDQTANNCGAGNAIESELRTYYGCGSICSDVSILGSLGVNLSAPPILNAVYNMPAQSCYNYSTINTGTLTVTNTGGTARDVQIYFGDVWGIPAVSNIGLGATELDTASVMLSINGGVAFHPQLIDVKFNRITPYNYNATASCGTELKPCGAFVNIPSIANGQNIVITYQFKKCKVTITDCPSGNYKVTDTRINFSVYQLRYKNACLDATYGDAPNSYNYPSMTGYGQTLPYEYVWQTLNQEFPTDMVDQQIATFTTNFSDGSYDYLFQNNGYVQVTQSLPPGFTLASVPNNIEYVDGGGNVWAATVTNANPLEIRFALPRPSNFDISSSKLNLQIQFQCAPYIAGPGSTPTVHQSWGVMTDPSCSSLMNLTCFDHTINLHCPSPCPEGIGNTLFSMQRISTGAPDNDNNGIADASGSINPALVRLDRAMVGDTIELSYHGVVYDAGTPFTTAFAHSKFPSVSQWSVLPNSEAYLYRGGSIVASLTNLTTQVNATDSLKTNISGLGTMMNLDSIVVKVRMRLNYNTGGALEPVVPDNILYATRPANPSTWLYCDHWNGRITKVGWYHTYYYGQNPSLTNCNANYIDITDYLSVGPCCNNYGNRSNIFPYEVKKYSYLDSVKFIIPAGLTLDHVDAHFARPGGANTANFSGYTHVESNVPTTFSGGFYRMGYKNYYADFGGNANNPIADDGWNVTTRVYVKASCTTPTLTNMYLQCVEDIKSISPNVTDAHYELNYPTITNYPRFATYNGSQLTAVAGASASKNIAGDTVRWNNLILANQSTIGSNTNTWVYIQKPTATTTIVSVTDNLGNAVPSANGFYQFGAMATSQQKIFNVIATTTSCNKDSVKLYYGYDCAGYPTTFSPSLCAYTPITLVARPLSAKIDGFVSALANTPADPANPGAGNYGSSTIDMCTPFPVEMVVNSALQGNIYDVNAKVQLPAGISYVPGSAYIEYPIGSTPRLIDAGQEAVLASVGAGGILNFKLDSIDGANFATNLDKGLFGTAHSPAADRQIKIRYKAQIDCDYQGGGRLKMTMLAKRACGVNATNNSSVKTSSRLNLTAPPSVYQNTIVNSIPSFNSCTDVLPATTTITKNGNNPIGAEDSILIEVPTGFTISTITCTGCPSSTVTPVVTSDGITDIYKWPYPAFTAPNFGNASPFTYSYNFTAPANGSCAANLELTTSVIEKAGFTCNAVACPNNLPVEGGSITSTFNYNKPTFNINPISVVSYSVALPNTYFINSTINNTSGVTANGFKLVYAYDVDNDSLYTAGTDILIDTKSYSNTISAGSNVVINESYTSAINPNGANFMVAILPLSTNPLEGSCACSEAYALAPISFLPPASLGDLVWNDLNNNGIKESGENGVQGIIVKLYNNNGDSIGVATTDVNGLYLFSNLVPDTYSVSFSNLPQYYVFSPVDAGSDDAIDSDPNLSTGKTGTYTLASGDNNLTVDAGIHLTPLPVANCGSNLNLDCTTTSGTIGTTAIAELTYSWSPSLGLSATNIAQPTANPSATTTYTVTVMNALNMSETCSVTVNVNTTLPTADAGSTQNLDCTTTSATIGTSSISGNTYLWSPSTGLNDATIAQPIANPTATTTYTVTVTSSNGCQATASVSVNVNTTLPSVSITGSFVVCNGSTTLLTATGGGTYLWSNLATTDTTTVGVGTYDVTVTSANGCTASTSVTVTNAQGSIGNYVWEDLNHNGINDEPATAGINGVAVELWKETPSGSNVFVLDQSTTTVTNMGNAGYYNFVICESANYQVKFPVNFGNKKLSIYTSTDSTDNNSDANSTTGISYTIAIDVNASGNLKDNMTIDAAYYSLAQLGNYVWNDKNKDGIQDVNEVGVAGITVTLYNGTNTVLATTITDAYGYYKFTALEPGDYKVGCTSPANYVFSPQNATTDLIDNDVNPATGLTGVYTLISGDSNMSVDAGIFYKEPTTATVGNYVWFDTNNDGMQDATEQGISGVTVSLYDNSGKIVATVITDANGYYTFTNVLPGTYSVGFTAPVGLVFSSNSGGVNDATNSDANPVTGQTATFVVNAGDQITYVDAGLYSQPNLNGAIGDKVWNDLNRNGVQDGFEIGVQGITVTLYQADGITVIATTSTDAYGNYIFNNLPQGQYVVGFSNVPSAYTLTSTTGTDSTTNSDADQGTGKTAIINLAQGQYNMTIDAGIHHMSLINDNSIGDFVWNDLNNNGIQEVGESGVSGVTVTLYDNTGVVIATTSTNEIGKYLFPDLPNGTFYVGFSNLPVGFIFTAQGAGTSATDNDANQTTGLTASVNLTGGTNITDLDAGIYAGIKTGIATLGDFVWYDLNNNGLQDVDESGVAGILVTLYQADGTTVVSTTTTDALGNYIFTDLASAAYVVGFANLPSGYTISAKNIDSEGLLGDLNSDVDINTLKSDVVIVGIGDNIMSVDMGIVPPTGSASLGNFVWFDLNNDGLQTVGEPGVQGVSVTLYNSIGTAIATTTTNANGEYNFVGLAPATYSVGFGNLPTGYAFAPQDIDALGVNGTSNSDANTTTGLTNAVTLFAGDNNTNLDAGIVSTTVASVGDYVWFDANHDGIQDANEEGMGGILVTLYDNNNVAVTSAITKPDGSYIFTNVTPGDYTIGFSNLPSSLIFTTQETNPTSNTGSSVNPLTGLTNSFTVVAGTHNPTIDAGLTTPIFAELGNYVWLDIDEDGLQGATEVGVPGVVVKLYAQDGITVLATAITDGNGAYNFTNLNGGSYVVGFSNFPLGATRTKVVGTIIDASNSDIDVAGKTSIIVLANGAKNPNVDAGIYFGVPLGAEVLKATTAIITSTTSCNVNWFTKNEINTKSFTIERSVDGLHFENVGSKEASITTIGNTNYSFTDDISAVIDTKVIYYRIVLNDIDNKTMVSNIISVINKSDIEIVIRPIPFVNEILIDYPSAEVSDLQIEITDLSGRVIRKSIQEIVKGMNTVKVTDLSNLPVGNYFIKVIDENAGVKYMQKISK